MGTRHLTIVQLDGAYKVAQYGQWDGYPEGQGQTVYEFLTKGLYKPSGLFREKVRAAKFIDGEQIKRYYRECGAPDSAKFVSMEIANEFGRRFPQLSRDTGAKILELIANSPPGIELKNDIEFAGSSLFCEWAYVLDLDKNVLEVYKGFVQNPESLKEGRFKDLEYEKESVSKDQFYYPITILCSMPFNSLPPTVEDFVEFCEEHSRAREWAEWPREEKLTWLENEPAVGFSALNFPARDQLLSETWEKLPAAVRNAFAER